ncbi:uncharacterized protein RAG0_15328 [Rhynchosporium agropyri]|uniref:Uncharacterized protein n=1 Tax=Rhynchosporium agropyri TaxID=914238 RepID=A0A1E1LKL2_9HELO|nr:uncharacterized protein RAG0_15328 [Rhynchosporium agropyri]
MKLLLLAFLAATTNAFTVVVCSPKDGATVEAAKEATVNQRAALGLTGPGYWNGNIQNCPNSLGDRRETLIGLHATSNVKEVFGNTPHVTTLENW